MSVMQKVCVRASKGCVCHENACVSGAKECVCHPKGGAKGCVCHAKGGAKGSPSCKKFVTVGQRE